MTDLTAELFDGRIVVTRLYNDLARHKTVTEYTPDGELLAARADYAYGIPAPVKESALLPVLFFEAILAGAYTEAAGYLSQELKDRVPEGGSAEFFGGFFGDFLRVMPDELPLGARLLYKKENGYETKLFIAELEGGLIANFR